MKKIRLIRKDEAEYMRKQLPKNSCDIYISSKTHKSRAKKYWICESKANIAKLKAYNDSLIKQQLTVER